MSGKIREIANVESSFLLVGYMEPFFSVLSNLPCNDVV